MSLASSEERAVQVIDQHLGPYSIFVGPTALAQYAIEKDIQRHHAVS